MQSMLRDALPTSAKDAFAWTWEDYRPHYEALAAQELTPESLPEWLLDWTALSDVLNEVDSRLYVAVSVNTADEAAEAALLNFAKTISEPRAAAEQVLKDKLLASGLSTPTLEVALQSLKVQASVFREANLPRDTQIVELSNDFDKLEGAQSVEWKGESLPLSMLSPALQSPERDERQAAWELKHGRILQDRESYNALWTKMYAIRQEMAHEAGHANFRDYQYAKMGRLDYNPADVAQFRQTILETVVPVANRIYARRAERLGLQQLRPWDTDVSAYGATPLRPFEAEADLLQNSDAVFESLDPVLAGWFKQMQADGLLDLFGRPNKAGGGYCTEFRLARRPFIFMNASGTHSNLQTLLHEAGHAFHAFACFEIPVALEAQPPIEFCEVASMGMEMLCQPHLDRFYSPADSARAQMQHLESTLLFWPYMAVVDGFQDWAHTHAEGADPAACDAKWTELWRQFMPGIDYSGLDEIEATGWHRKLHIFQVPFYYVEYGLAQIGAYQVWRNSQKDLADAVTAYRAGLALGSTVGLPELFAAVGGRFAFDAATLSELAEAAEARINELLMALA